jgi:hypothetical protein|tara:strand:+ start:417 stop:827 length:411 start_codon:yes stop_codon:yes gene_type:complete
MDSIKIHGLHADADLSAKQYHAVYLTEDYSVGAITNSNVAAFAQTGHGVLQNDPNADGQPAEVIAMGIARCEAGGSLTYGARLVVNNDGEFIAGALEADLASADRGIVGYALEDAADGEIFYAVVNFATPLPHDTE